MGTIVRGLAVAAAAGAAAALASLAAPGRPVVRLDAGLLIAETPTLAWSFDTAWRVERLHDLRTDPGRREDAAARLPAEARWLRGAALARLRLKSLDEVPKGGTPEMERLKSLGYL
jgi:hypothetical protein